MQKKILLWFDVEDYLTVESDDSLYALLCMLEESGVKATLKFCTRKLELLHTRGRTDILEKLGNHEFSFHHQSQHSSPAVRIPGSNGIPPGCKGIPR